MKLKPLLLCLALVSTAPAAASELHGDLIRHATALERAVSDVSAGRLRVADSAHIDASDEALRARIDAHRNVIDASLLHKAERLEGLRSLLRQARAGAAPAPDAPPALQRELILGEGVGATCASALSLRSGDGVRHAIGAGATVWYRVDGPADAALRVSTRGSTIDPALAAFADCRVADGEPLAVADDSFGLQADLTLIPKKQTFWYVRATNLGGRGELVISAVQAIAISGRVTRAAGGGGIASIRVAVFRNFGTSYSYAGDGVTDASGNYVLSVVGSGTYAVRTGESHAPYAGVIHQAFDGFRCTSIGSPDLSSCGVGVGGFTPIVLTDPGSRTIDFALDRAGGLTGTISSSAGGPVVGAGVSIHSSTGSALAGTATDIHGRWRIDGVPTGGVLLMAGSPSHATTLHSGIECTNQYFCPWASGTLMSVPVETVQRIDMTLRRLQFIDVVFTLGGSPLPIGTLEQAIVPSVVNSNGVQVAQGYFQSPGRYRIGPLAPGSYRLRAVSTLAYPQLYPGVQCITDCIDELTQGTPIVLTAADAALELNMDLRRYPHIEGTLTSESDGSPIADALICLFAVASADCRYQASTNFEGNYRVNAVAPGTYVIRFASNRHVDEVHDNVPCTAENPALSCLGATLVTVGQNTPDLSIDAALARSASLSGRIDLGGLTGSIFVSIALLSETGVPVGQWWQYLASDGRYTINDLPSGTWRVAAGSDGFIPQLYDGIDCPSAAGGSYTACAILQATPIVTSAGMTTTSIDFALHRTGTQSVRVLSAIDDDPLPGVSIDVWGPLGQRVESRQTNSSGQAFLVARTFAGPTAHALSTYNTLGFINEVYQDIPCANGSVFFGTCALTGYLPVLLPAAPNAPEIVIRLAPTLSIFENSFE